MRRRYISALAAVLAAALSVTPLSARAADTQDYEARFERIREQMLSDFESGEYRAAAVRTPQTGKSRTIQNAQP